LSEIIQLGSEFNFECGILNIEWVLSKRLFYRLVYSTFNHSQVNIESVPRKVMIK